MTRSYVWHDLFMSDDDEVHALDISSDDDEQWTMIHSCVWHDLFICMTWLVHVCHTTHARVWSWRDMAHSYVWHASFIYALNKDVHSMCRAIKIQGGKNAHDALLCGSLSAKEPLIMGFIVEMTSKNKALYASSPPCTARSRLWHDASMCMTWRMHVCSMPSSCVLHIHMHMPMYMYVCVCIYVNVYGYAYA